MAERDLESDVRASLLRALVGASGDAPAGVSWPMLIPAGGFRGDVPAALPLPAWLTQADLDFYSGEFARTGFRGGLNWYRNIDRNWELMSAWAGVRVTVPALYIVGEHDASLQLPGALDALPHLVRSVPNLRPTVMLAGCGHWVQQERPAEVNAAMLEFVRALEEE